MCDVNLTLLSWRGSAVADLTVTPFYLLTEFDLSHVHRQADMHAHRVLPF